MQKKIKTQVDLTGYIVTHHNQRVMLNETIHGRLTLSTKSMLTGNRYQKEKVMQKLN